MTSSILTGQQLSGAVSLDRDRQRSGPPSVGRVLDRRQQSVDRVYRALSVQWRPRWSARDDDAHERRPRPDGRRPDVEWRQHVGDGERHGRQRNRAGRAHPAPAATPTPPRGDATGGDLRHQPPDAVINNTPTGGTLTVPACVYRETVTISRAMTVNGYGSVIDGRDTAGNLVRSTWLYVSANDVTVARLHDAVRSWDQRRRVPWRTRSASSGSPSRTARAAYSFVNVNLTGAIDSTIRNCSIHDAYHLGVRVSAPSPTVNRGQRNTLVGNRIFHNQRTGDPDPGADGGNLKASGQDYLTLNGNDVSDSGVGLWLDVWCRNTVISNNRVFDNDTAGIHDETSTGTRIFGNAVWKNGFGPWGTWGWGAGILIHSSKSAEVSGNTLAWNHTGISVVEEDRSDSPGVTDNYIHDNVVVEEQMVAGQERFGCSGRTACQQVRPSIQSCISRPATIEAPPTGSGTRHRRTPIQGSSGTATRTSPLSSPCPAEQGRATCRRPI